MTTDFTVRHPLQSNKIAHYFYNCPATDFQFDVLCKHKYKLYISLNPHHNTDAHTHTHMRIQLYRCAIFIYKGFPLNVKA
jgi:hypothetical protein